MGGNLPESVGDCANAFKYLRHDINQKVDPDIWRSLASEPLAPERRRATSFEAAEQSPFVPYLPPAAGIALGRLAGLNPLGLVYAGRLANLALAVVLLGLAIRLAPVGRVVFGLVALLPVSVQQMASLSPDASIITSSLLLTALLLRAALVGAPAGWKLVVWAGGLAAWVTACRITQAPLTLLALAVPRRVLGSWFHYVAGVAVISAAVLLPVYATMQRVRPPGVKQAPRDDLPEHARNANKQTELVRNDPLRFVGVVGNTWRHLGGMYLDHLFTLGWTDTAIPRPLAYPYAAMLLFVTLASPAPGLSLRVRAAALAAVVAGMMLVFLGLYTRLTEVGAPIVFGIQGRYLLPFLPAALLLLSSRSGLIRVDLQRLLTLAVAAAVAELIVSLGTLIGRYYCPDPWTTGSVAISASVAVVAGLVVWFLGRRPTQPRSSTAATPISAARLTMRP
jgi:uncharacterized membrane protein